MKSRTKKKLFSVILALAMVFSLSAVAFAQTSDTNLTNYDTNYSYTVKPGTAASINLMVVPATDRYVPTSFDSEADAAAVQWRVVPGSTSGVSVDESSIMGFEYEEDVIVSYASVDVSATAAVGAASIEAKNPATGATMNFTIVVDNKTSPSASQGNVNYKFYDSSISNTNKLIERTVTVSGNDYYGNTHYPSALDGVQKVITDNGDIITNPIIESDWGSPALKSLTFNGHDPFTNYTDYSTWEYYGWQYRVYRDGKKVELSELLGADDCQVLANDTVIWIFGKYGEVKFPSTI